VAADLGLVGWAAAQEHVAHRPPVEPGDQQHPAPVPLSGQAVGAEAPLLPEGRDERGQVGRGCSPDLHRLLGHDLHPVTLALPADHVTAIVSGP
jgi:hypothetical protein